MKTEDKEVFERLHNEDKSEENQNVNQKAIEFGADLSRTDNIN